jgi:hypothetical protein
MRPGLLNTVAAGPPHSAGPPFRFFLVSKPAISRKRYQNNLRNGGEDRHRGRRRGAGGTDPSAHRSPGAQATRREEPGHRVGGQTRTIVVDVTGLEPATSTMRTSFEASDIERPEQAVNGKEQVEAQIPLFDPTAGDPDLPAAPVATGTRRARKRFRPAIGSSTRAVNRHQ